MPLTDSVAGWQTEGPARLTITDLQYHARCVGRRGGKCDSAVSWHSLGLQAKRFLDQPWVLAQFLVWLFCEEFVVVQPK